MLIHSLPQTWPTPVFLTLGSNTTTHSVVRHENLRVKVNLDSPLTWDTCKRTVIWEERPTTRGDMRAWGLGVWTLESAHMRSRLASSLTRFVHVDKILIALTFRFLLWNIKITIVGTSLVVQWLRIHLPMQGTRVRSLIWEDPTCRGTTKPVRHNYWAHVPQLLKPVRLEPCSTTREATTMRSPRTATKSSPHSLQLEKARIQQRRPNPAKNKNK